MSSVPSCANATTASGSTLGPASDFPPGETRLVSYRNPYSTPWDGATANIPAYVRCAEPGSFTVFAINCAHLGCPVRWFAESQLFMCPCHGGVYYADGSRASGPPTRGLFTYEQKIENGHLMIKAGQIPTLSNRASLELMPRALQPATAAANHFQANHFEDRPMPASRQWYWQLYDWLERRIQLEGPVKDAVLHPVPRSTASWWYVFGSASLTLLILQVATGICLALVYSPSAADAWQSLASPQSPAAAGLVSPRHARLGLRLHDRRRPHPHGPGLHLRRL